MMLLCQRCDVPYPDDDDVCGCCSIRCALDAMMLDVCPWCGNTGLVEASNDPYMSDLVPCPEGCTGDDWWVKAPKVSEWVDWLCPKQPLDDSDVPF